MEVLRCELRAITGPPTDLQPAAFCKPSGVSVGKIKSRAFYVGGRECSRSQASEQPTHASATAA